MKDNILKTLHSRWRLFVLLAVLICLLPNPYPAQEISKVVFDETRPHVEEGNFTQGLVSQSEWYGCSIFADNLEAVGYSVSTIENRPITYEKLQNYDVLVIVSNEGYYSLGEIKDIEKFVENGGGLLLAVDTWYGDVSWGTNKIARHFELDFAKDVELCDPTDNFGSGFIDTIRVKNLKSHEITEDADSFYINRGTYLKEIGNSTVIAYSDNDSWADTGISGGINEGDRKKGSGEMTGPFPVLSVMSYGEGRIIFVGDSSMFLNDWIITLDNELLALNMVNWLAKVETDGFSPSEDGKPSIFSNSLFIVGAIVTILLLGGTGTFFKLKTVRSKSDGILKPPAKELPTELKPNYPDAEYVGEGGFAWVFKATRKDGERVAVKVPKSYDAMTGKLFIREVSNWSNIGHENIVNLYDFNIYPIPYVEMELCDESLKSEGLSIEKAISVITDVAKGLRYAHERKIIHGDLKPANILIKGGVFKISDWGLSRIKLKESVSLAGLTPQYAAPEQVSNDFGKADERTDIYQLGAIFYELVTGKPPFEGDLSEILNLILYKQPTPPSEINPSSKNVEPIIMRCLKKRKEERYNSIDELLKDLKPHTSNETTLAPDDETVEFHP